MISGITTMVGTGRARPALNISDQNWEAADQHPDYYSRP